MTHNLEPFICDGISLGIPNGSATDIAQLDNILFLDEEGNLHFRDEFVRSMSNVLGTPVDSITLKDLMGRMRGVFIVDGKLHFKDSSVPRAYSLDEIVGAYNRWQSKLTNGGIFWMGRTQVNLSDCDNVRVDVKGDPTIAPNEDGARLFIKDSEGSYPSFVSGTKVYSLDADITEKDNNGEFGLGTFNRLSTGEWRWHDIPNLQIEIPPANLDVSANIFAKVSTRLIKTESPVIFRLYDETSGEVLDMVASANDSDESAEQQITLTHIGELTEATEELKKINCICPNPNQEDLLLDEPSHIIRVQYYVDDVLNTDVISSTTTPSSAGDCYDKEDVIQFNGFERRLIGLPNAITDEPIVNSSIDVILYNTTKTDKVGRKSKSAEFSNSDLYQVTFETPFDTANYSITLSPNKNINTWYTNKKPTGFVIRAEKKFSGTVDWSALKVQESGGNS